jgi:ribosomal protein S19E (S16A)
MKTYSMSVLQKLLDDKKWNISDLAREYGKYESPELSPDEAIKKYGSMIRKAVTDPDHTKHGTVKRLIEVLGGELIVKVKRVEELSLEPKS